MELMFGIIGFIFWLITVIEGSKKGIGCLSAILGLLGPLGLIIVLILPGDRIKCPYCKEYIDKKAIKCPKCQSATSLDYRQRTQQNYRDSIPYDQSSFCNKDNYRHAERILNKINTDKYVDIDYITLKLIRTDVFNNITSGISLMQGLKPLLLSADEAKKKLIVSYAETMRSDYIQALSDETAYESGDLYWEFVGPYDDKVRDACIDLLYVRYFTNFQRKLAEKLTANERAFGCRHCFMQIVREDYEMHKKYKGKNYIKEDEVPNPNRVSKILND